MARGVLSDVGSGREDGFIDQIVFVDAPSKKESPTIITPLILEETAPDVYGLIDIVIISYRPVLKSVIRVLDACNEL